MLHIVRHHNLSPTVISTLQAAISPQDVILLIENGIYLCHQFSQLFSDYAVYALNSDMKARALPTVSANIIAADYQDFVQLTEQHTQICYW